ncbi:MAG: peroxiredoxin family protein [Pirellulaceae bacterium]
MTTLRDQTNAQFAKLQQSKPVLRDRSSPLAKARDFGDSKDAIAVGQPAPDFVLPSAKGESIELSALLTGGPVVIVFYRSSWCPYCNLQLRARCRTAWPTFEALGGQLGGESEVPDESLSLIEKKELKFTVLSDKRQLVAAQYGVAWKSPN